MLQIYNNGNYKDVLLYEDSELNMEVRGNENKTGSGSDVHISAIYLDNVNDINRQYTTYVIESKSIGLNKRFVKILLTITDMTLDSENFSILINVESDPIYGVSRDIQVNGTITSDKQLLLVKSRFNKIKQVLSENFPKDGKFLGITNKKDLEELLKLVDSGVILGFNEKKSEPIQPNSN